MNEKIKTIFIGTPDFGVPALNALINDEFFDVVAVVTQPDKKIGRKQVLSTPPIKQIAGKYKIQVLQPDRIKNFVDEIKNINPDLIVVAAYAQILPKPILELPKFGCVNIHGSLLPKYRGASCIQGAIMNGENTTGVTFMKMDVGLDTGDIIAQFAVPITKDDTTETIFNKLSVLAGEKINETIKKYIAGDLIPCTQDDSQSSLTKILEKENGKIDWQKSAEEIERFIRAMYSWPIAFTNLNNKKLQITKTKTDVLKINKYQIGEVFLATDKSIAVQCGQDALILDRIKLEGKNEVDALAFSLGNKNFIGSVLN